MKITEFIKKNTVILDGGMGSMLQASGLGAGERPEVWNLTHPEIIKKIHSKYLMAGSHVISTNTFGANRLKFDRDTLRKVIFAAVRLGRESISSVGGKNRWLALDLGPTGRMLRPLGDLDFEDAVDIFSEVVRLGVEAGVDLIFIETMSDSYETKAALLAAKECSKLPVFVSNAYGEDGKLMTGATPAAMVALLEGMGADAIGVNCSLGPRELSFVVEEYLEYSSLPIILKPNAGLPRLEGGKTVYDLSPSDFTSEVLSLTQRGVRAIGGCCGTTPEYIKALADGASYITPLPIKKKNISLVSSYTHARVIGERPLIIGERINPTGKRAMREAVSAGDRDYILREAIGQQERGADILDVNLGIPGLDEAELLSDAVRSIQEVVNLPLQIDSSDPVAMEKALRIYNGKPMINSVNGKEESLEAILPLVKKYGGVVVALTLDEKGIPKEATERLEIAKKILSAAKRYGIDKKDIIFDPLAMAVSADSKAAIATLDSVGLIKNKLGAHTSLGVSNISYGLPERDRINSAFFTMALQRGLSAAIINPYSERMTEAYRAHLALMDMDAGFEEYISSATGVGVGEKGDINIDLSTAILRGLRGAAARLTRQGLSDREPMELLDQVISALDKVGEGYESKKIYLPGLLMSAEAAGEAFDLIRAAMPKGQAVEGRPIVIATVKGDIHDIGKNIVKMLLESYGHRVIDLGKDVSPADILSAVTQHNAAAVALSALMTTTLPAMKESVQLIRKNAPECKIMVGGAVLTDEYAKEIGADFYGKDAMDAVRYAEKLKLQC